MDGDGKPSGHFYCDRKSARAVSSEVLHSHFFSDDKKVEKYLENNFENTFAHFDVNKDDIIEVERMP
jgi:homoserine acetyltransferase